MASRARLARAVRALVKLLLVFAIPGASMAFLSDSLVYPPTGYDAFQPPPGPGGSYSDPVFGTRVIRLSDALNEFRGSSGNINPWTGHEYSIVNAVNADGTLVLLQSGLGGQGLWRTTGGMWKLFGEALPVAGGQNRWSATDPNVLYFVTPDVPYYTGPDVGGNAAIKSMNVQTGAVQTLRAFPQYTALYFTSSDVSPDGDYLTLLANGRYAFWYRISTNTVGPVVDRVAQLGFAVGVKGGMQMLGPVFTIFNYEGTNPAYPLGLLVFDGPTMTYRRVHTPIDHGDFGLDADGTPIYVMPVYNDPACTGRFVTAFSKFNLLTGSRTLLLCGLTQEFHMSLPANLPGGRASWVLWSNTNLSRAAGDTSNWAVYENELVLIPLDGSRQARRLAHHRSQRPAGSDTVPYNVLPLASVSRDGTKVVFHSNYGQVTPPPTGSTDYVDAYLLDIAPPVAYGEEMGNSTLQQIPASLRSDHDQDRRVSRGAIGVRIPTHSDR